MEEITDSIQTSHDMLRAVLDHPDFLRVWQDRDGVDRYLFVSEDGEESYSAHGLIAAHGWAVNHPFVHVFPNAPMITRLKRTEKANPTQGFSQHSSPAQQERAATIKSNYPFPWESSDEH